MARVVNQPGLGKGFRLAACLGAMALLAIPSMPVVAGVDLPKLEHAKGDKCVDEGGYIRRHHPELLKHHRDETMRKGIRTTKYSLKKCVECHAGSKTGSVAGIAMPRNRASAPHIRPRNPRFLLSCPPMEAANE